MKLLLVSLIVVGLVISCGENSTTSWEDDKPTNLTATLIEDLKILIEWEDNSSDEIGFVIQRKEERNIFQTIFTTEPDITSYIDSLLSTNTVYYYRVAALFEGDQSDWSNVVDIQTPVDIYAPSNLSAIIPSNSEVQIYWTDNTSNETGFIIERKIEDEDFTLLYTNEPNDTSYNDTSVEPELLYTYRVAALYEEGQTDWSNELEVLTPPIFDGMTFGTDTTFEIMTWNIEHFPLNDEITVGLVAEAIRALEIDLIALQEIESEYYFNNLVESLEGWDGYRANSSYYDINLAYLYKTAVINMENIYEISEYGHYFFPRYPLVMEFSYEGFQIISINNHLKAGGYQVDEDRRREASIRLQEYIEENFHYSNVIVLGDLNDEIQETEEDNVFWNFIEEPDLYQFADMEIAQGSSGYWSYPGWPSHLDHILITNELFYEFEDPDSGVETIRIDTYLDEGLYEYEQNISDHRPVALRLDFNN
jgi:endonuclease/exonuclease/phosphatase family metal-dependent hydrolase